MQRLLVCVALASALLSWTGRAAAQPPSGVAAAEVLFQDGQKLFDAGDYTRACPKFRASYDLDSGLGTLLNLARCYEKAGRTASAWAAYVDLAPLATRAGQGDRAAIAQERIAALEPDLMRLELRVPGGEDIEVLLDDNPVAPQLHGSALPVDPGEHRIVARRPGSDPYWSTPVTLSEPGKTVKIVVEPPPPPLATPVPPPAPPPRIVPPTPALPPPLPDEDGNATWWIAGLVVGGVGIVSLGVAAGFTADAASAWNDAGCADGLCADQASQSLSEQAGRSADVASGLGVAGGLLTLAGATFVMVGLLNGGAQPDVSITAEGLSVRF